MGETTNARAKIASDSFQDFIKTLKEGMTESELAANIVYAMMKNGASGEIHT